MSGQTVVLILGVAMTAVTLVVAGQRVQFLTRLITNGQPAPERIEGVTKRTGIAIKRQLVEVLGQKKMLKWSIPGTAHAFVMYAFIILVTVYFEAYAALLSRNPEWHWFVFGNWAVLGFLQDFIAVMCFFGIVTFALIRVKNSPVKLGRKSRFKGSHLSGAWITLFMIFNVLWTLFLFRGAVEARDMGTGHGYGKAAFASYALGKVLPDSGVLIGIGLLLHIGVMLVFLVFVLHSKHLHIFIAPLNIAFGRRPVALGAVKPLTSGGEPVNLADIEDMDEDTVFGVGKIEDFSWKGMLDFASCTECGRCQSQCPAWNTEKPLSPKLLIMGLRDHAFRKAPYLLADSEEARTALPASVLAEAERPLVGVTEGEYAWHPEGGAIIDNDVLWSCTSCGACVNQCPVDIEHVDHIIDMRRYQVLVESNFPAELNGLFKGLENKGNPWNMSPTARMEWAQGLPFDVKVAGGGGPDDPESLDEVDWLFWVGCAGAYEDRAKKTTRAVAELLNMAGVDFAVLGNGETCTGDPARRAGNEFVFQGLATQNAETFKEMKVKKVVSTCAHCFNTLKNEYSQFGVELEVVHHTQLLNRLVREKKLTPVAAPAGSGTRSITYHDPCYLGRHNQVYSPPRELIEIIPDATFTEMPRNSERSFCCGAGGARMWMEETIGERINVNRTKEAVGTGADQIAVGCPFCRTMLEDGLTQEQSSGNAREEIEVLDVAQLLLASVKGEAPRAKVAAATGSGGTSVATKARPEPGDVTQTENTVTETADVGPAAKASGGSSLFDAPAEEPAQKADQKPAEAKAAGGSLFDDAPVDEPVEAKAAEPATGGGSLFDTQADEPDAPATGASDEPEAEVAAPEPAKAETTSELGSGSLFDVQPDEPTTAAAPTTPTGSEAEPEPESEPEPDSGDTTEAVAEAAPQDGAASQEAAPTPQTQTPATEIGSGSLFDIVAPSAAAPEEPKAEEPKAEEPKADEPKADEPKAEEPKAEEPKAEPTASASPAQEIGSGSLFDIAAPEPAAPAAPEPTPDDGAPAAAVADEETEPEAKDAEPVPLAVADEPAEEAEATGSGSSGSETLFDIVARHQAAEEPDASQPATGEAASDKADSGNETPADGSTDAPETASPEEAPSTEDSDAAPADEPDEPAEPKKQIGEGSLFDL